MLIGDDDTLVDEFFKTRQWDSTTGPMVRAFAVDTVKDFLAWLRARELQQLAMRPPTSQSAMSPQEAWLYAAQWGSFMSGSDPGACMYGFSEDYRPQSEQHREAVLAHIERCRARVIAEPEEYDSDELERLDALAAITRSQPLAP